MDKSNLQRLFFREIIDVEGMTLRWVKLDLYETIKFYTMRRRAKVVYEVFSIAWTIFGLLILAWAAGGLLIILSDSFSNWLYDWALHLFNSSPSLNHHFLFFFVGISTWLLSLMYISTQLGRKVKKGGPWKMLARGRYGKILPELCEDRSLQEVLDCIHEVIAQVGDKKEPTFSLFRGQATGTLALFLHLSDNEGDEKIQLLAHSQFPLSELEETSRVLSDELTPGTSSGVPAVGPPD